ncbi:MAG: STAS/SEC14 domain-containing protein [Chthoniobacterales bacterium]|nr:STAS/SEC14 domain-containing protein [Chthoniobacterales bacterium]
MNRMAAKARPPFWMHKITENDGNLITVRVSGKLTQEDYDDLIPTWKRLLAKRGTMRMLFIMDDFHGWTPAAAWDDLRFGTEHASKVERVAMVGEKKWQEWLTKIGSIFVMRHQVKYFDTSALAEAERWVRAG